MTRLSGLASFVYEFVVGDDPLIALAVVVALGITGVVAGGGIAAWWIMPSVVLAVLGVSVGRAAR